MENPEFLASGGFLDPEIQRWIQESRRRYPTWFGIAVDVNRFALKVMLGLDVHNRAIGELLLATLYLRILHTFEGTILMAERGMLTQGRMLARSMLEAVFPLVAIAKDPATAGEYVEDHKLQKLKFFRKAQQLGSGMLEELEDPETKKLAEELKDEVDSLGLKGLRTEDLAKKAGLHNWYLTAYAVLSGTVHSRVGDLEEYLVLGENEQIKEFDWGPRDKGLEKLIMTVAEAMLIAIEHVRAICKIDAGPELTGLRERLNELVTEGLVTNQKPK
jgi:hypothetical protein